jgi:hypothetical protein
MPKCTNYASNMHMHIHIMHICAYPSMTTRMCILVRAILTHIWMSTSYCMTVLCWICIKMNIWKKSNFEYDYMHIWVLSEFISGIFNIFRQHWSKLEVSVMSTIPCGPILCPQSKLQNNLLISFRWMHIHHFFGQYIQTFIIIFIVKTMFT